MKNDLEAEEVTVVWEDSKGYSGVWVYPAEVEDFHIVLCQTKGFVVRVDKREILVGQTIGGDQYHNLIAIPKRSIIDIK